jgi:predicted nucleic acid-binding protein
MGDKLIFVDTNILIFISFTSSPFHQRSVDKINSLQEQGFTFSISRQIIREYLSVKSKLLNAVNKYIATDIALEVRGFDDQFIIADENNSTTVQLLLLIEKYVVSGKQVHDCNIVATMLANNISQLVTNNSADFLRYSDLIEIITI